MMPGMELSAKNFDDPDEVVRLPGLLEEVVEVGGFTVGRERGSRGGSSDGRREPRRDPRVGDDASAVAHGRARVRRPRRAPPQGLDGPRGLYAYMEAMPSI
jgi:hypothetical protein